MNKSLVKNKARNFKTKYLRIRLNTEIPIKSITLPCLMIEYWFWSGYLSFSRQPWIGLFLILSAVHDDIDASIHEELKDSY